MIKTALSTKKIKFEPEQKPFFIELSLSNDDTDIDILLDIMNNADLSDSHTANIIASIITTSTKITFARLDIYSLIFLKV